MTFFSADLLPDEVFEGGNIAWLVCVVILTLLHLLTLLTFFDLL